MNESKDRDNRNIWKIALILVLFLPILSNVGIASTINPSPPACLDSPTMTALCKTTANSGLSAKLFSVSNDLANDATTNTTCRSTGKGIAGIASITGNFTFIMGILARSNTTTRGFIITVVASPNNLVPSPTTPCPAGDSQFTSFKVAASQIDAANIPIMLAWTATFIATPNTIYAFYVGEQVFQGVDPLSGGIVTVNGRATGPQTIFTILYR